MFIRKRKNKSGTTSVVVVADSGLMSPRNIKLLEDAGYKYILGARIRSESPVIKEWMLSLDKTDGNVSEYAKESGQRLIVSYSDLRARKSASKLTYASASLLTRSRRNLNGGSSWRT